MNKKMLLAIMSMIVIFSMCFSVVAYGNNDHDLPIIPIPSASTSKSETPSGSGDETPSGSGDETPSGSGDETPSGDDIPSGKPVVPVVPSVDGEGGEGSSADNPSDNPSDDTSDKQSTPSDSDWETPSVTLPKPTTTAAKISVAKCTVAGVKNKVYTGKNLTQAITVKYGKTTLKLNTDYTVKYSANKNVGVATLTIAGKGKFNGSVKKTFKIMPKGTALAKLSTPKKATLKVTWKKQAAQTNGYQIQYSTSAKFTGSTTKTVTVTNAKTTAKTIAKLKSKKKYYVRVRTYKNVGKTKYYSSWSAAKNIKLK